ncbi:unnamed protein product [Adineta steineri]|uniref:Glycosyl transferase family 25 domain-containing protein n=1 Tax=Adineta steineri TaxID=433720 RepID=A0A813WR45_9BILA|nr:unnamed protein product [Adineta steineri]CAF1197842.1 unnamed protein product [Adineta steineri]
MTINKPSRFTFKIIFKRTTIITIILTTLIYSVKLYISLPSQNIIVNLNDIHKNITFTKDEVYFLNGTAYDFYSIDELYNHSEANIQWKTFPLPDEHLPPNIHPWIPRNHPINKLISISSISTSQQTNTGLAFVDHIYITSAPDLKDRQANIERMFSRYQITNFEWRMQWARNTCNLHENKEELYRKINLKPTPIRNEKKKRQCAITMEHVDIWHDIVARNFSLSLILEDDAVFVPFFQEKFNRTIYTAIRTGALKIGELATCIKDKPSLSRNSNEWFEQDPLIFIGTCMGFIDSNFARNRRNAQPILTTHKETANRCSHAYLLTACSAQALIRQIFVRKNTFLQSDLLLQALVAASPTLQSFWLDPPLVYQGNRIKDLDGIPSFRRTTYNN